MGQEKFKMKLKEALFEGKNDAAKLLMKKYFRECSKKHFPELHGKFPEPTFEVKAHAWAGWFKATGNVMGISTDLAAQTDDFNVKSTVYHETIHYYQFHTYTPRQWAQAANGGHDAFFHEKMQAINAVEGSGFINIKHEQDKISKSATEINVYGFVDNQDNYAFMWTPQPSEKLENWLQTSAKPRFKHTFSFKTDDFYFKSAPNRYKGGSSLKFGVVEKPDKIEFVKKFLK